MTLPTDVLQQVLDSTAPDSEEARAVRRDLDRIRRGMQLLADDPHVIPRRVPALRPLAVAAGIAALIAAGVAVRNAQDRPAPIAAAVPSTSATTPPLTASGSVAPPTGAVVQPTNPNSGPVLGMPAPDLPLPQRVQQADRIVVGTVTKLTKGELKVPDGESTGRYVLATVSVSEALKPTASSKQVVAFDYDYGGAIVSSEAAGPPWVVGQRLLLFLVSDAGTVSESLQPAHQQVAEGARGRYEVKGDAIDAPFTLDDVRRLARG